jgi:hypothetical protein
MGSDPHHPHPHDAHPSGVPWEEHGPTQTRYYLLTSMTWASESLLQLLKSGVQPDVFAKTKAVPALNIPAKGATKTEKGSSPGPGHGPSESDLKPTCDFLLPLGCRTSTPTSVDPVGSEQVTVP